MKRPIVLFILFLLYLFDFFIGVTHFGGENSTNLRNLGFFIGQISTILFGLYSLKIIGRSSSTGKTILFFSLGIASTCIGSTIFAYYQFISQELSFPSIADIFSLLAYPLFFFSLITQIKSSNFKLSIIRKILISILFLALSSLVIYFGMVLPYDSTAPLLVTIVKNLYEVADLLLIGVCITLSLVTIEYRGGKFFFPWIFLFSGIIVTLTGDILFAIYSKQYYTQPEMQAAVDIVWRLAYVFFAFGLFLFGSYVQSLQQDISKKLQEQKV